VAERCAVAVAPVSARPAERVAEGILFGIIAAVGWGVGDVATAVISRGGQPFAVLVVAHTGGVGLMTLVLVMGVDGPDASTGQWVAMLALGPVSVLTFFCLFRGLQLGPLAIVSPLLTSWSVVTLALAVVVLGETLAGHQMTGAALIVAGALLASLRLTPESRAAAGIGGGVVFGLAAVLGLGFYNFFVGHLSKDLGWFMPLYVSRAAGLAIMVAVVAKNANWPWRHLDRRRVVLALAVPGVFATLGSLAFGRGAELGHISITAAATGVYPLIPIIAGMMLLREHITPAQGAGVGGIIGGLLVLALAG
jgi:drug/metabolite transporter (DMT)-like permease